MADPSMEAESPSPAEAYARFRQKQASPLLAAFADGYGFVFDDYQREACAHIEAGSGVLVAAPTGAGKTIVGEFAVFLARENGRKCFYTTPIKALSNQKYTDLVRRHGAGSVGLLRDQPGLADVRVGDEILVVVHGPAPHTMAVEQPNPFLGRPRHERVPQPGVRLVLPGVTVVVLAHAEQYVVVQRVPGQHGEQGRESGEKPEQKGVET